MPFILKITIKTIRVFIEYVIKTNCISLMIFDIKRVLFSLELLVKNFISVKSSVKTNAISPWIFYRNECCFSWNFRIIRMTFLLKFSIKTTAVFLNILGKNNCCFPWNSWWKRMVFQLKFSIKASVVISIKSSVKRMPFLFKFSVKTPSVKMQSLSKQVRRRNKNGAIVAGSINHSSGDWLQHQSSTIVQAKDIWLTLGHHKGIIKTTVLWYGGSITFKKAKAGGG